MFKKIFVKLYNNFYNQRIRLQDLPSLQRRTIINALLLLNLLIITIVILLNIKVHNMVTLQEKLIHTQTVVNNKAAVNKFESLHTKQILGKIVLTDDRLIDIKSQTLSTPFILTMKYPESWYTDKLYPKISVDNGVINSQDMEYREVVKGIVEVAVSYRATINTTYSPMMYPLDKQLVWLNVSISQDNKSGTNYPYLKIDEFNRNKPTFKVRNYHLAQYGFINSPITTVIPIGNTTKALNDLSNSNFLLYDHKNVLSYFKTTQYIILALFIALFALLINQKNGTAISGRISVIGSSVFSLSANVFQINSLVNQSSGLILIDIISVFAGLMILICFLITVHTIKISDKLGFEVSVVYDNLAFKTVLFYIVLFFNIVYLQA